MKTIRPYTAGELVTALKLSAHPEGGYYSETYRAGETVAGEALPERFVGARVFSTAIYFLLEKNNFSAFHRIKSDECWHFYAGDTLHVHVLYPDGEYALIKLGADIAAGESFQALVPAGCWFASETAGGGGFSLVGCTVSPGFDFVDFELAKASQLADEYPAYRELIARLCRR